MSYVDPGATGLSDPTNKRKDYKRETDQGAIRVTVKRQKPGIFSDTVVKYPAGPEDNGILVDEILFVDPAQTSDYGGGFQVPNMLVFSALNNRPVQNPIYPIGVADSTVMGKDSPLLETTLQGLRVLMNNGNYTIHANDLVVYTVPHPEDCPSQSRERILPKLEPLSIASHEPSTLVQGTFKIIEGEVEAHMRHGASSDMDAYDWLIRSQFLQETNKPSNQSIWIPLKKFNITKCLPITRRL